MIQRSLKPLKNHSFFLFGPRGSGKSTWLEQNYSKKDYLWFNLLEPKTEMELKRDPELILKQWELLRQKPQGIIIDEVQKLPQLLDVAHKGIETYKISFILTGSSARKLKRGSANLLAGRAFEFFLHPFSSQELGTQFDLNTALQYGLLPQIYSEGLSDNLNKERYLYSYISTYLKEELLVEQVIRNLDPFQKFLEVAAQSNGKLVNFSKTGRDAGVEPKQVERYFPILKDTLIGFFLEPFHRSIRKRQIQRSKFYFFDPGVVRTLTNKVSRPLTPGTYEYGNAFEHFLILEFLKLNDAFEKRFRFSYFQTDESNEIDLIIEKPGGDTILVELKSSHFVDIDEVKKLENYKKDFKNCVAYYLSLDTNERVEHHVRCLHWRSGIKEIFSEI